MKIALAQINPTIGALESNRQKIVCAIKKARESGADLVLFPEMALSGYPPEDLLLLPHFVAAQTRELMLIEKETKGIAVIVGVVRENPTKKEKALFNSAAIFEDGKLIGFQDKRLLPEYDVFSERRYFEPGAKSQLWTLRGKKVAVTVCEDIWQHGDQLPFANYSIDPVLDYKDKGVDCLVNLSSSPFYMGRQEMRYQLLKKVATTISAPVFLVNSVGGNDSLLFDGHSMAVTKEGKLAAMGRGFEEDLLIEDLSMMGQEIALKVDLASDLFHALTMGLKDYFQKLGFKRACIGLSGGIDSALVAALAVAALGKENVLALMMPSRFTSKQSFTDANQLAKNLEIAIKEISIEEPYQCFLDLLVPHFEKRAPDITEENLQARIRGMILMAFSNKFGFLVLSTGNKSEMAMGYATLYGDMCGGLSVLGDVTKEQVYLLSRWINREREIIPHSIIERPPTAELRADQKDTDTLPEYPIVDAVLREYVEEHLSPDEIAKKLNLSLELTLRLIHQIHLSEYKRRQAPPSLRVTKRSFSVGRRFPIVQRWS